jgi:hypothetical protein
MNESQFKTLISVIKENGIHYWMSSEERWVIVTARNGERMKIEPFFDTGAANKIIQRVLKINNQP